MDVLTNPFLPDFLEGYQSDQFVFWRKVPLGQGKREVIPSCVIMKIREIYPDPFNHSTSLTDFPENNMKLEYKQ